MSPRLLDAAPAPEDHPGKKRKLSLSDPGDVATLLACGSDFTITSRGGFHVRVNRFTLDYMLSGLAPDRREQRFKDDGTSTRWLHRDPTLDQAIHRLIHGGGPFVISAPNGVEVAISKEKLAAMCVGVQSRMGRVKKNRQGKWRQHVWLDPIPAAGKNNPTAVEFGDENSGGVYTNKIH